MNSNSCRPSSTAASSSTESHSRSVSLSWLSVLSLMTLIPALHRALPRRIHRYLDQALDRRRLSMLSDAEGRCCSSDSCTHEEASVLYRRRWERRLDDPSCRRRCVTLFPPPTDCTDESTVGVGIVGKEGRQASLAADFSITQFSFLTKLLVWHGRNSYKRSAKLAQFVIHRGLIISVIQGASLLLISSESSADLIWIHSRLLLCLLLVRPVDSHLYLFSDAIS
jgi:hypothetical protein